MENDVNVSTKKGSRKWQWLAIISLVLNVILIVLLIMRGTVDERVIIIKPNSTPTKAVQEIRKLETNFNDAQFKKGKSELNENAKAVLHELGLLLNQYPDLRLLIEGHTSAEGRVSTNQKLSEARAKAAMDYLVQQEGVKASRLRAVGYGSSRLKNEENPNASENRRTEFIVIE